jgi:hypothetical protein
MGAYPATKASLVFKEDEVIREVWFVWPVMPPRIDRTLFHADLAEVAFFPIRSGFEVRFHRLIGVAPACDILDVT